MWPSVTGLLSIVLGVLLSLPAPAYAQEGESGRDVDGQLVTDTFTINHQRQGDTLWLSIRSDLPDDATLMVSVDRYYWEKGSSDTYYIPYLSEKATIAEWEDNKRRVVIDDQWWQDSLHTHQDRMARIGVGFSVRRIEDSVRVDFTVPAIQDDPRFGEGNENLVGEAVRTEGARVVEEELVLTDRFGSDVPTNSNVVAPRELEAGNTYRLAGTTPLMPAIEPENPLRAAAEARQLAAGTHIEVRERRKKDGEPWYRVTAYSPSGEQLATGWVNSTALLSQEIRIVR